MKLTGTKVHEAANIFPVMSDAEYQELKADIDTHGQRDAVTFWGDELIDGRHRWRACQELGIDCDYVTVPKRQDPVAYVVSTNLHRRHLSTSQRSMVAAKMANMKRGDNQHTKEDPSNEGTQSVAEAATLLNVGHASVERAKQVIDNGSEELQEAVERGEVSVTKAAAIARKKPREQQVQQSAKKAPSVKRSSNGKPKPTSHGLSFAEQFIPEKTTFQQQAETLRKRGRVKADKLGDVLGCGVTGVRIFKLIVNELHYMQLVEHPNGSVELVIDESAKDILEAVKKEIHSNMNWADKRSKFKYDLDTYKATMRRIFDLLSKT